ncbi:type III chaperone protein ShcF [Erwinia tracheiphila]|uniref:Type III chaperone protein ShcF n=1 Tax=Erwinia tracheiphila TaxID=65700 RepID=A0A345CU76_9GAMM|nr:type III chaperone protein ShcF [Erwinia tracheiphila]AXF76993.1 type III chaperone protein ShcF [Erwinia tracheiphila]UIA84325.1 type III chaperone protein ShcF [Erwinia tracheiphila]UIA92908.1 type III chaperone protein ShcF [Erwinia tracheiphila]
MRNKEFHTLCRCITKIFQPDASTAAHQDDDVYMLVFDHDLSIHLIGTLPGYINIVATFVAPADWFTPAGMESLLIENRFSLTHPTVVFGMDSKRKKLIISTRQIISELNDESVIKMFRNILHLSGGIFRGEITLPK